MEATAFSSSCIKRLDVADAKIGGGNGLFPPSINKDYTGFTGDGHLSYFGDHLFGGDPVTVEWTVPDLFPGTGTVKLRYSTPSATALFDMTDTLTIGYRASDMTAASS